jgi:cation transport ATPase
VLTGESLPVSKQAEDFMVSGTLVARGTPHLGVLATGRAELLARARHARGHSSLPPGVPGP